MRTVQGTKGSADSTLILRAILHIRIDWPRRKATVTSLIGGHLAESLDLGRIMEITIKELPEKNICARQTTSD